MARNLVILLFLNGIAVLSQNLAGQYEFWDYYGSYVYDYSGNTRHAEISNSGVVPIFTDRGLYIHTGYTLKFPNNSHNVFPTTCTDMLVSVLLNPKLDTQFCLLKLSAGSKSIQVCFKNTSGKVEISIEGSITYNQSTSLNFNGWRLYTIRFFQVSGNTLLYVYLDGDDTNTALILFIASFSFVTSTTYWDLGSTMEGFLYQIWWNCQVTTSIQTLTYSMISISSLCATLNVETPLTECLSNELDKFKNSAGIACPSTCTSLNQSCDKDQDCISSCKYKCLNPSQCRSTTYPVCSGSPPAGCIYYPNTDICYSCNTGWLMSTIALGVCEITVPNCKTFNSSAVCTECNYGYYMSADNPPACIQCHSGCEKCALSFSTVICLKCFSGNFRQLDLSSCSTTCPDTYYGSTITDPDSCQLCYPNCKTCAYKSTIYYTLCSECNLGYFIQPRLQVFVYWESYKTQCATTCPIEYYPDGGVSPASCMPCKPKCEDCTSNSNCTKCIVGYILDSTTSTCNQCVYACRECISTTECSKCTYWYWLEETTKVCKLCSRWCLICVNDITCQQCYSDSNTLILNGITTCKISCGNYYYIVGHDYECLDYSETNISYCIVTTLETQCQNCLTTSFGTSDCPITICPANCKHCYTINSVIYCTQCPYGHHLQPDSLSCQTTCPDFYYKYDRFCYQCKANCKICQTDSNYCEECGNDHSLSVDMSACVSVCPTGHYSSRSGIWKCQACISDCDVCTGSNDCQTCKNSWYIVINDSGILSCQELCPSRTYSKLDKVCGNCMANCDVCALNGSVDLICSTCAVGYLLKNNNCYEKKCDLNCLTCVILTTELRCDLCKDTYYIQPEEHLCATTCPDKYYPDNVTKRCQSCSSNCESCVEFSPGLSSCTLCSTNHIFKVSLGVNICEFATCPASCTDCTIKSEGILCNTCSTSYFMQPWTKECKTSCPTKYYGDTLTNTCKLCSSNCLQCSSSECQVCSNGYYLQPDKTCLNNCPDGYYKYLLDKTCKECGLSNCLKCDYVSSKVICTLCKSTYYIRSDGSCNTECEDEYYKDSSNMKCEKCPLNNCARCLQQADSSFYCQVCINSYYLHALELQPCFAECPSSYFKDDSQEIKACSACPEPCKTCTSASNCSECDTGNYLQPSGSVKNCDITCPNEYFKDDYSAIKACSACPLRCKTCFSRSQCSKCIENYYLRPGLIDFCDEVCPGGYYGDTTVNLCIECGTGCEECDMTGCKKCNKGYYIQPDLTCNSSCPLGSYLHPDSTCGISCPEGFYTENLICSSKCSAGYYEDELTRSCLDCDIEHCYRCKVENDQIICIECKEGMHLYDNRCTSSCGEGYYTNSFEVVSICSPCINDCILCTGINNCLLCTPGLGYSSVLQSCTSCPYENCLICDNQNSALICKECKAGYYLISDSSSPCTSECPEPCQGIQSIVPEEEYDEIINKSSSTAVRSVVAATAIGSMVSLDQNVFISSVNTIKLLSFLIHLKVSIPSKIRNMQKSSFDAMKEFNLFNYIKIEGKDLRDCIDLYMNDRYSYVLNTCYETLGLILILILNLIFYLLDKFGRGIVKLIASKILKHFKYSIYIQYFMLVYLEVAASALEKLVHPKDENLLFILDYNLTILCVVICTLSPILLASFVTLNKHILNEENFQLSYGYLVKNIKETLGSSYFHVIFLIRRLSIAFAVNILENPYSQTILFSTSCLLVCIQLIVFRPFQDKMVNMIFILIELNTATCYSCAVLLLSSEINRENLEWVMLVCISLSYLAHLVLGLYKLVRPIYAFIRSYLTRRINNTTTTTNTHKT